MKSRRGEALQGTHPAMVLISSRRRVGSASVFEEDFGLFTEGGRF
jgi:hypothetical protein